MIMETSKLSADLENLFSIPFYITGSAIAFDLLATMLVFAGVIILYTSSTRPGRFMMFFGLLLTVISLLLIFFIGDGLNQSESQLYKIAIWYLPLASSFFMCICGIGFFKFALSFKNENKEK